MRKSAITITVASTALLLLGSLTVASTVNAAEPAALNDGHQRTARGPKDRDVISRHQAPRLQCGTNGSSLVVDLTPREEVGSLGGRDRGAHEADARWTIGCSLQAIGDGTGDQ